MSLDNELYIIALQKYREGDSAGYIAYVKAALEASPKEVKYYIVLGDWYLRTENYSQAIEYLSAALEIEQNAEIYRERSLAYLLTRQYGKAAEDMTASMSLSSPDHDDYFYRGELYAENKNFLAAINDYSYAIALKSNDPMCWYRRALAYQDIGQIDLAKQDFQEVIKMLPEDHIIHETAIDKIKNLENLSPE